MAMFAIGVAAATAQVATMNLSGSVPAELNGKKMYIINLDTRERIDSAVGKTASWCLQRRLVPGRLSLLLLPKEAKDG